MRLVRKHKHVDERFASQSNSFDKFDYFDIGHNGANPIRKEVSKASMSHLP
jgi:hypothetical protein